MKRLAFFILIFIFVPLVSCGRKNSDDFYRANRRLAEMKSYTATAEISVIGNKGVSNYKVKQYWCAPGKLRLETQEPDFLRGKTLVYDGIRWKISHPLINDDYEVENLNYDDQIIYIGVIQGSVLSGEDADYRCVNRNGKQYIESRATLQGGNEYRKTVALFMDGADYYPETMEIYDSQGELRVRVKFIDFNYNAQLKDSLFRIN